MDDPDVRPLSLVEDRPVIRQIGDRDLYLGNVHAADPERHDRDFAFVLSATAERQPATTHHHPLRDGPGNDWGSFAAAVDTSRTLQERQGALLVHCKAGVSRSTTLLATSLAAETGTTFRRALETVREARPVATPHPRLRELAVYYLADRR